MAMKKYIIPALLFSIIWSIYALTAPANHSEAEDVYQFAKVVEQGTFADQVGVNRLLALPMFGAAYRAAQVVGYSGRAFPFMIFINRLLAMGCVLLFWKLVSYRRRPACPEHSGIIEPGYNQHSSTNAYYPVPIALLFAFSYGFWRYANEAETYILASILVLGAWCLAVRGRWVLCMGVSALGVLVHLLNLIPLLLIIPFYYLLSKEWKKALIHGGAVGVLVLVGYVMASSYLDWGELGAQHHAAEAGMGFSNFLRGGIAFGQCVVSGNFLFGFEGFRELLIQFFPSRMLGEEFYMAKQMPRWIKWMGGASFILLGAGSLALGIRGVLYRKAALKRRGLTPLWIASLVWLFLYAVAVLRTESGSPELWIMALIPFWLVLAPFLQGRVVAALIVLLFVHNLIAGLLPVLPASSDYHRAKGQWLVENSTSNDLILTSYEPVMIFYLNYFSEAEIMSTHVASVDDIEAKLGDVQGRVYALSNLFEPLESMQTRNPILYEQMQKIGATMFPRFEKTVENEWGGIYSLKQIGGLE